MLEKTFTETATVCEALKNLDMFLFCFLIFDTPVSDKKKLSCPAATDLV